MMGSAASLRYVIVSPVKDEARYIELTLRSITRQTVKPHRWVIVDDGSTDGTADTVRRYVASHPFIRLVQNPNTGPRRPGAAVIRAFNCGYDTVHDEEFDLIVKLDCDLSIEADYFEKLLGRFRDDHRLGIASGIYLERDRGGSWQPVKMPSYHAFGACKVVRQACFEQIGGFLTTPGWDTVDEIRALNLGWTTRHFPDLCAKHHKQEGSAIGPLPTSVFHGEIYYVTGGDPLFLMFKVLHRMSARPFVISALALMAGYVRALITRKRRLVNRQEARCYRQLQRQRLFGHATGSH